MKPLIPLLALLLLAGCAKQSDLDQLKNNLGPSQYLGLHPDLRVKILSSEPGKKDYEYNITGIIEQTADFPLSEYAVSILYTLKFDAANTAQAHFVETIKDRSVAFRATAYIGSISDEAKKNTPIVTIDEVVWWPIRTVKVTFQDATQK